MVTIILLAILIWCLTDIDEDIYYSNSRLEDDLELREKELKQRERALKLKQKELEHKKKKDDKKVYRRSVTTQNGVTYTEEVEE